MNPKISVIIPVYNVEKYLIECVNSVLVQSFQDYEMILVDDGSTDNSGRICDEYAEKYSQIKVIHKKNGGLSDARNFGIKEAKGDYLIFLDSDDLWKGSNRLLDISYIIETQNQPDIIFYGRTPFFNDQTSMTLDTFPAFSKSKVTNDFQKDFEYLLRSCIYRVAAWDKVIKRDIIINHQLFFPKGKLHEDVAWCYDIIPYINNYSIYPECFYFYRRGREDSISYKLGEKSVMHIIDIINKRVDNTFELKGKNSFLYLFMYIYTSIIIVNILSKENFKKYYPKVEKMSSFLFLQPLVKLTFKQKIRFWGYKVLGIKLAGKLEYKLRKALNKL